MFIAFLPRAEALALLETHDEHESQANEIEAEIGSSLFYNGVSSWDASTLARQHMNELREDFERSEEGQVYMARLEAARFMVNATYGLRTFVPEFMASDEVPF